MKWTTDTGKNKDIRFMTKDNVTNIRFCHYELERNTTICATTAYSGGMAGIIGIKHVFFLATSFYLYWVSALLWTLAVLKMLILAY